MEAVRMNNNGMISCWFRKLVELRVLVIGTIVLSVVTFIVSLIVIESLFHALILALLADVPFIGMFWIRDVYMSRERGRESLNWIPVEGTIISSNLELEVDADSAAWIARIKYEYEVNGERFISSGVTVDDVNAGAVSLCERRARKHVNRYPVGASVTVYHDPNDPSQSVLEPGVVTGFHHYVLGLVLVISGIFLFFEAFLLFLL